jgi:hypothetical protein
VTGPLVCEQYTTRAGERASRWFCRATSVTFLDRPGDDGTACDNTTTAAGAR